MPIPNEVSDYLRDIGRRGGSRTSEKKKISSAKNAKLGGWPKGRKRKAADADQPYTKNHLNNSIDIPKPLR